MAASTCRRPTAGRRTAAGAAAVLLMLAAACGNGEEKAASSGKPELVAAFYPIEFAARRLAGGAADVSTLTPAGAEPHDLELKPSDVRRLQEADLVLFLGGGFQPALDDAVGKLPDQSKVVDLLAGLDLRPPADGEDLAADPHVWLSPAMMVEMVDATAGALAASLPAQKEQIRQRASALRDELEQLDTEFETELDTCERRQIFTSHAAFGYLADRYGLKQIPITGLSPEAEPSSARLREIAEQAAGGKATTIFFETLVSPRVAESVARTVGAKTAVLDPIEGLTPEDEAAGADYFSVMRSNLAALKEALGCSQP